MATVYAPRSPTTGVLYEVVRTHLADFLAAVEAQSDGAGLPSFVTAEFRKFLGPRPRHPQRRTVVQADDELPRPVLHKLEGLPRERMMPPRQRDRGRRMTAAVLILRG
jgi:hypothetical protein